MYPKNKSNKELQIIPLPNGPSHYFTDFEPKVIDGIVNSRAEELRNLKGAVLCHCGASDNKPFCVGTRGEIGFSDRKETVGLRHNISVLETIFEYPDKIENKVYENGQNFNMGRFLWPSEV
jgi:CDGSH-type Zn-finger protein